MKESKSEPVILCIPVYDDWKSVYILPDRASKTMKDYGRVVEVLLIDDCPRIPLPSHFHASPYGLGKIEILQLRRNPGHHRAI